MHIQIISLNQIIVSNFLKCLSCARSSFLRKPRWATGRKKDKKTHYTEITGMSTSVIADSMVKITGQNELDFVECDFCGLTEECTLSYIETVRERYQGKWICGLCSEAVNDEVKQKSISPEEAMARHFSFCNKFRLAGPPPDPTRHLITAMRQVLRKSLDSPKFIRAMPSSPTKNRGDVNMFTRSESCIPSPSASVCCGIDEDCE